MELSVDRRWRCSIDKPCVYDKFGRTIERVHALELFARRDGNHLCAPGAKRVYDQIAETAYVGEHQPTASIPVRRNVMALYRRRAFPHRNIKPVRDIAPIHNVELRSRPGFDPVPAPLKRIRRQWHAYTRLGLVQLLPIDLRSRKPRLAEGTKEMRMVRSRRFL